MGIKNTWSKFHLTLKIGLIIFALGVSPLLIGVLVDALGLFDLGSGLGLGLLFFISFWPSLILIIIGTIISMNKANKLKSSEK